MENLFEVALNKNELLEFTLGRNEYYILDREYGVHCYRESWNTNILPLIKTKGFEFVNNGIELMFETLLNTKDLDEKTRNECLINHLHVYYYLGSENKIVTMPLDDLSKQFESTFQLFLISLRTSNNKDEEWFINAITRIQSRQGLKNCFII